jgi:hypothetical protein
MENLRYTDNTTFSRGYVQSLLEVETGSRSKVSGARLNLLDSPVAKTIAWTSLPRWGNDDVHSYNLRIRKGACDKAGVFNHR